MINTGLTIGSDPEFCLLDRNDKLVIPRFTCKGGHNAKFGIDGGGLVCELRPTPGRNENDCAVNIGLALRNYPRSGQRHQSVREENNTKLTDYKWRSGPYVFHPVGGHMHFGHTSLKDGSYISDSSLKQKFVRRIAEYVAVPALLTVHPSEIAKRRNHGYGSFVDAREQPWGIEYRSMFSWLFNKDLTIAIHSLAFLVAKNVLIYNNSLDIHRNVRRCFNATYSDHLKLFFPVIWNCIKKLKDYKQHEKNLEIFPFTILNDKYLKTDVDLKTVWEVK